MVDDDLRTVLLKSRMGETLLRTLALGCLDWKFGNCFAPMQPDFNSTLIALDLHIYAVAHHLPFPDVAQRPEPYVPCLGLRNKRLQERPLVVEHVRMNQDHACAAIFP